MSRGPRRKKTAAAELNITAIDDIRKTAAARAEYEADIPRSPSADRDTTAHTVPFTQPAPESGDTKPT
jgi:hypothetical protein